LDFVQIVPVAGGKIIETRDLVIMAQQGFQQVRADESGNAGDKPAVFGFQKREYFLCMRYSI